MSDETSTIAAHGSWGDGWAVDLRVWIERSGRAVIGPGRLELLEAIDRWHSISAAARHLGMSYRRAWELVQGINESAGEALVQAATGGRKGGGATLTARGRWTVAVFRVYQDQLHRTAATLLGQLVRQPDSPSLHLAAAASLEEVVGMLVADFTLRHPSVRVRAVFGASDELTDQILSGAPTDLILTADDRQIDRLEQSGRLVAGSRRELAENGLAVIAAQGRTLPVRKPADLVRAKTLRLVVAGPECPLGRYTRSAFDDLHLPELPPGRVVEVDSSRAVVTAIRAGHGDAGIAYRSDAVRAEGCRLLFRLPQASLPIRYYAACVERGARTEGGAELLAFLTSPAAAKRFRACGFDPLTLSDERPEKARRPRRGRT